MDDSLDMDERKLIEIAKSFARERVAPRHRTFSRCRRTTFSASSLALGLNFGAKRSTRRLGYFHIGARYPIRRFLPARMEFRQGHKAHPTRLISLPSLLIRGEMTADAFHPDPFAV